MPLGILFENILPNEGGNERCNAVRPMLAYAMSGQPKSS
jgi:hypothetical protein